MRRVGKINVLSTKFEDYNYVILGQGGVGKTTLVSEIGQLITGSPEGTLILTIGLENEVTHIPNAFAENVGTFDKFIETVDELVQNRSEYPNTKFIAPDSIDELFRLAEDYVVRMYNDSVDLDKRVKSIKQAYGGFQGGENKVVDVVIKQMSRLKNAGYHFLYIGHVKTKSRLDPMSGVCYDQLTCALDNKYYYAIKDKVDLVATGYFEIDFANLRKQDNPFTKEKASITKGEFVSQRRVMSLIDDENVIDTKTHFEYIVPKIALGAKEFIGAVEDALKKKAAETPGIHKVEPLPTADEELLAKMREAVRAKYKAAEKGKKDAVKEYLAAHDVKLDDATEDQLRAVNAIFEKTDDAEDVPLDEQ